jgi:hypothetical protein
LQVDKQYLLYHILWAVTFYQLSQIQIFNFFFVECALNLLFTKIPLRPLFYIDLTKVIFYLNISCHSPLRRKTPLLYFISPILKCFVS